MQNNENEVVYLYLDDIIPNRFQPRQVFDERALKELAISIKEHGVIQPIIVRNIGNKYEIIAGERRYKASALAGLTKIPAIIRNLDDKESSKVALLENLQRKNLNPIEEARTYQKILELDQLTQEELAKTMGKSQGAVANKIRLLSLSDDVQDALLKEQISERHARTLLNIEDASKQKEMLKEIIAKRMTVRELEDAIKQEKEAGKEQLQEISPEEIEKLLSPTPVSLDSKEDIVKDIIPTAISEFNQTAGIDYSSPPKFIDYQENDIKTDGLLSSASTPINIDEVRANAKDINVEKPVADLDSLLRIDSKEEEDTGASTDQGFKFFSPLEENNQKEEKNEESTPSAFIPPEPVENKVQEEQKDLFTPLPMDNFKAEEATSMDSLLQTVNPTEENSFAENIPSYIDTYNNPFAKNPLFADNIQKIEAMKEEQKIKYNLNEAIDLIREAIKKVENSGMKIDAEEMNLDKNYQIVIKIDKNEESIEK